jgi:hypothetical protein
MADPPKLDDRAVLAVEPDKKELIAGAYRDFNARRIDAVLARMQPDVDWPTAVPESPYPAARSPSGFFLKKKPPGMPSARTD